MRNADTYFGGNTREQLNRTYQDLNQISHSRYFIADKIVLNALKLMEMNFFIHVYIHEKYQLYRPTMSNIEPAVTNVNFVEISKISGRNTTFYCIHVSDQDIIVLMKRDKGENSYNQSLQNEYDELEGIGCTLAF